MAKVFDIFLFVFKHEMKDVPNKIYLLKGLDLSFNDEKMKIYITKEYKYY